MVAVKVKSVSGIREGGTCGYCCDAKCFSLTVIISSDILKLAVEILWWYTHCFLLIHIV
jgi:hypothetical protein